MNIGATRPSLGLELCHLAGSMPRGQGHSGPEPELPHLGSGDREDHRKDEWHNLKCLAQCLVRDRHLVASTMAFKHGTECPGQKTL